MTTRCKRPAYESSNAALSDNLDIHKKFRVLFTFIFILASLYRKFARFCKKMFLFQRENAKGILGIGDFGDHVITITQDCLRYNNFPSLRGRVVRRQRAVVRSSYYIIGKQFLLLRCLPRSLFIARKRIHFVLMLRR